MMEDIKKFNKVNWKNVEIGQVVWIAGNLKNGKPNVCYGPHTVADPDNFQLKSGGNGILFYERWPCLYTSKEKFTDNRTMEERILNMMTFSDFEEWYKNEFVDFIEGSEDAKSKNEMVKDIKRMMQKGVKVLPKQKKVVTDPCPECGCQIVGKGIYRGGGVECSNPKCNYWFCY